MLASQLEHLEPQEVKEHNAMVCDEKQIISQLKKNEADADSANADTAIQMNSQFHEMVRSSQNDVGIQVFSEYSPEEWFLKYKHEKGKTRLIGARYIRLREMYEKVVKENAELNSAKANLLKKNSELRTTLNSVCTKIQISMK